MLCDFVYHKGKLSVVARNNGDGYFLIDTGADEVGTVQLFESVDGTRKQATIQLHAEPLRALVVTGRLRDAHPSMQLISIIVRL